MNPFHPFTHMPARPPSPPSARFNELKAENAELRRRLAAKEADTDDESPGKDEIDPADIEPNSPPKKGKKKTKKGGDDVDKNEDEEEQPARPDEDKPEGGEEDNQRTAPPKDTSTEPERLSAYWRDVDASTAAIVAADARRRGERPYPRTASGDDGYWAQVSLTAAAIIAADKRRRGVVESSVPLPSNPGSRMILAAYYKSLGRQLTE